jgi:hypothetical protein
VGPEPVGNNGGAENTMVLMAPKLVVQFEAGHFNDR